MRPHPGIVPICITLNLHQGRQQVGRQEFRAQVPAALFSALLARLVACCSAKLQVASSRRGGGGGHEAWTLFTEVSILNISTHVAGVVPATWQGSGVWKCKERNNQLLRYRCVLQILEICCNVFHCNQEGVETWCEVLEALPQKNLTGNARVAAFQFLRG